MQIEFRVGKSELRSKWWSLGHDILNLLFSIHLHNARWWESLPRWEGRAFVVYTLLTCLSQTVPCFSRQDSVFAHLSISYPPQFPSLHCLRTCNVFPFYFYVKCCPSKADLQRPWGGTNLSPFIKWFDIPLKPTILYAGIYRHPGEGLMHVINMAKHLWDTIAAGTPHFHHSNSNTHILRDQ